MSYRLSADIGGTFTDLVLVNEAGEMHVHKTPSTPRDFTQGILNGAKEIVTARLGSGDLGAIDTFVHGATVVLNALLQLKLPRTGLITTTGFRDVLEIMRTNNPFMYDLQYVKPSPLVPRSLRLEVGGRIRHTGEELVPLNEDDVRLAAARLRQDGVEAVGVCLIHAYASSAHERRVGEILAEELPGVTVCLSSDVAPEWREFERTSTTCINAATVPIISSYLGRLSEQLKERGLKRDLLVMQSNGGVMTTDAACKWPVRTVMSGPSGGVVGAATLAAQIDVPNVVTLDIGGTSSDMGVIANGRAITVVESVVADAWPVLAPMIEILSIGAGGGSIAWLDAGDALRVGPQSAGADPAPICYGKGGTEPTVTDANVVLGRIDPEYFLGGRMRLDVDGAREGVGRIADAVGLSLEQAADGIVQIANTHMSKAIRSILIERGYDPRDFVLMGFGGGGGLHTAAAMRELSIPHGIVPSNPGALSAIGMLGTDFRHDRARTLVRPVADLDANEVEKIFAELEGEALAALIAEGVEQSAVEMRRSADLRYVGQEYHLSVSLPSRGEPLVAEELSSQFNREHERIYGYSTPDSPVQLVNLRLVGIGHTESPALPRIGRRPDGESLEPVKWRKVYFAGSGWTETPIYSVENVLAGDTLPGPSILEDPRSTMLILPGQSGEIDELRNLHIYEVVK
ncbi:MULTISPECIES: hydantoinase/oxoprolinase family protein [Aminobacter]|uniref:hydantoinase/oxoprolinase family protein n=1 Tax=Aminobacter TaxID=31988 RepID=UPI0012B11126|nr:MULTISPECIES: hydantoinase/oxoprolinase family protein [Aminobacter]MDR7224603.1 N-methylhydantoinase A [Aminobacter aminovorans]MRX37583.1 hydantoinase/oxoprolinase family protein [Aminobacter sp. MDW-2]QNH33942.1 hydantoinase/oxoprolinase family protein [Aminobacter sp. MDW-2]